MVTQWFFVFWAVLGVGATDQDKPALSEQVAVTESVAPSLVRVEYTLQYDKGEPPRAQGCIRRCPRCGEYHVNDAEQLIREERPLESAGFLIAPKRVVATDPIVHPRFVKSIAVRFGDRAVPARVAAVATTRNAIFLDIDEELPGAKPMKFDGGRPSPYLGVTYERRNGLWTVGLDPFSPVLASSESGKCLEVPAECLVVAKDGTPVGLTMSDRLSPDNSWKGAPDQWPSVRADEMLAALAKLDEVAGRSVLRVTLSVRSPRGQGRTGYHYSRGDEDDENSTERNVVGLLLDEKRVLVLAALQPRVTARLEKIVVHPSQGKAVPATFTASLDDYGGFVATLKDPLPGPAAFAGGPIVELRDRMLLSAEVMVQGEKRVAYYGHGRLRSFDVGWQRQIYPVAPGDNRNGFLFDSAGTLVALPIQRRQKVAVREEWASGEMRLTPAAYVRQIVDELARHSDQNNVPLPEDEENRLAWMGVELQGLNRDLARANNVSDLTNDGQSGALVTYVHPDSPAAKSGVEAGCVLLRLHAKGQPKPLDIRLQNDRYNESEPFPWESLEDMPSEYLDQMPKPWPSADSTFTRLLTDLGVGTPYTAEFFVDGKVVTKDFSVVLGPRHFDTAPRYKSEPLGLTVRDLTYEVRRYFQKKDADPGVIVSKTEPGAKAAVAGVLPYEIITHVNDAPVTGVKEFEKLVADQKQLRLSVNRKNLGRIVKIDMTAPTPAQGSKGGLSRLRSSLKRMTGHDGGGKNPATQTAPAENEPAEPGESQ